MINNREALEQLQKQLNKKLGDGTVVKLSDSRSTHDKGFISTGSAAFDKAIGGGIPKGRITEIFGPEGAAKSSTCFSVVAEAQRAGETAAYIDMEHACDKDYMAACGVDVDNTWFAQPDTAEQALEVAEAFVRSGLFGVVVVDSVASLVPQDEASSDMSQQQVGLQARLMGKALRKLAGPTDVSNTAVVFVNQLRDKVGGFSPHGTPEITPGGRALKYTASVRIRLRRGDPIKDGAEEIGFVAKAKIVKNKVGPPLREAEFPVYYGRGLDEDPLHAAEIAGVVTKAGPYYSYGEVRLGKGKEAARAFLGERPELAAEIAAKVKERR